MSTLGNLFGQAMIPQGGILDPLPWPEVPIWAKQIEEMRQRELADYANAVNINPILLGQRDSSFTKESSPTKEFQTLKKSIKAIEAEPFDGQVRKRIETKINRLEKAGAKAQATILERELRTKDALIRLKEWYYKILTREAIHKFNENNQVTLTRDGIKLHIDSLEQYIGAMPRTGDEKNHIIPDKVLDDLETAQERELFDEYAVLWAEKVKDPLLLGIVEGCEDYFLISEWGDDITFEQICEGKE